MQRVESCHLFAVLHAPREGCRELSLVICLFSCQSMHMSKDRMKEECKKRTLVIPCSVFFWVARKKKDVFVQNNNIFSHLPGEGC